MESTGERFIPGSSDPFDELAVEHQQRYHSVQSFAAGKSVLDAGCGEGYGSHLLSKSAARVAGIDLSEEAVAHARASYRRPNLNYQVASVAALPFEDGSFDLVVCFEVIEHLEEELQNAFLREARRVLREHGVLIISTPNKAVYTDLTGCHNRYHKKEFHIAEFEAFLGQVFPRVAMFGQGWFVSSVLEKAHAPDFRNLQHSGPFPFAPKYVVAVCGATAEVDLIQLASVVVDRRGRLEEAFGRILQLQDEIAGKNEWAASLEGDLQSARKRVLELQEEVSGKNSWAMSLEKELQDRGRIIEHYQKAEQDLEARLAEAHRRISALDSQIETQIRAIAELGARLRDREAELASARAELEVIKGSDFWKIATRYWRIRDAILPKGSARREAVKKLARALRDAGRSWPGSGAAAPPGQTGASSGPSPASRSRTGEMDEGADEPAQFEPVEFPAAAKPMVSIIVPALNHWSWTYRCMKSIRRTMAGVPCEIILADDGSTDETRRAGELLPGVRVVRNRENLGFLRNCNRAAGLANGRYLYFLNNDTELQPDAIQALVRTLERDPAAGMAGSKLVYPDGRLQEAGGIIWSDGSGWNYGRYQNPDMPAFNYLKEADYVSGASLMIRASLWKAIGGFDEQFAPAYGEDSDLALSVRKQGFKVCYQPQSAVVHHEGVSHGTDVARDVKSCQARNTGLLAGKWNAELARQFPNGARVFHARDRSAGRATVLLIDHYVPQFDRDAGSRTIWSFIQVFLGLGMNVKFLGDNFCAHQPYTDALQQSGVEVLTGAWFADHWQEWLQENGRWLDYVLLSRPHIAPKYLPAVRSHTGARILYYVHDLHYMREMKLAELRDDEALRERAWEARLEESGLMSRMDAILSCSDIEAGVIRSLCPGVDVFYVPPYVMDVDLGFEFRPDERRDLLFVGGFAHPPNVDGILWFVREVWPDVRRRLPGAVFNIAGSHPPPEVLALGGNGVRVLGFVTEEQLEQLYRAALLVVIPLRYGGGVKGKTVEAMAHGVPIVCTDCSLEGMPGWRDVVDPRQHAAPLSEGIAGLYGDRSALAEISRKQRAYVARHFNREMMREAFVRVFSPRAIQSRGNAPG